jgi:DsbC/DsbD-like thiol-disulfide interchange protein
LAVAAISYDSVPILKSFADRVGITFSLLSDPDSKIIQSYGILNEATPKGMYYGIPYPGTYILDAKSVVVQKYFEDDYTQRYTASDILSRQFGASVGGAHSTIAAKHLQISASAGVEVAHIGQRIGLALDIDLPKGMHVYAPGVQGYIPIDFTIAEASAFTLHPAVYPPSKSLRLEAIKETVPVYTEHIRVLREITMTKAATPGELTVEGALRYQACDDRECFIPETVPLKWKLRVEPLDRQRAPAEIQHK